MISMTFGLNGLFQGILSASFCFFRQSGDGPIRSRIPDAGLVRASADEPAQHSGSDRAGLQRAGPPSVVSTIKVIIVVFRISTTFGLDGLFQGIISAFFGFFRQSGDGPLHSRIPDARLVRAAADEPVRRNGIDRAGLHRAEPRQHAADHEPAQRGGSDREDLQRAGPRSIASTATVFLVVFMISMTFGLDGVVQGIIPLLLQAVG